MKDKQEGQSLEFHSVPYVKYAAGGVVRCNILFSIIFLIYFIHLLYLF